MKMGERLKELFMKRNTVMWMLVFFFGMTMVPLLFIGRYNVMSADDYAMGKEAVKIWRATHNPFEIVQYAGVHTWKIFMTWQGCFTINFLDCFNPGFFGEQWTWLTPFVMLASVLFFLYVCCKNVLAAFFEKCCKETFFVWGLLAFLIIQTMPSPVEGLYWYSGAVAYTFLHYFMFAVLSVTFKQKNVTKNILFAIGMFLVGGSHSITALECLLISCFLLLVQYKQLRAEKAIPVVFLMVGFLANLLAPGNRVRQSGAGGMNPVQAILQSFVEAVRYGKEWTSPLMLVCLLFLIPIIFRVVSKGKRKYSYPCPVLVSVLSFCIFAAAFTPSLYGVGNVDAGRIQNLIQSMYYAFVTVNIFYWIGWMVRKMETSDKEFFKDLKIVTTIAYKYAGIYQWICFGMILLVFIGTGDKNTFSAMSATRSLLKGEAQAYYAEAQKRLSDYCDEEIKVVYVEPFSIKPHVLFFNDVHEEGSSDYWINENIAAYYGKEKIVLME